MYDELVKQLRNRRICVQSGGDLEKDFPLMREAADAIEELQNKLCDWCGVCPKERRRPSDCEIIYPNMQVPEVAIIPAEEGET